MQELIFFILGAIITWGVTHIYYSRSNKDQIMISHKLSSEIKELILKDKRESLSVKELNEILLKKTIDETSKDPLPYKLCPKCGSDKLKRFERTYTPGYEGALFIECENCGWSESVEY